MCVKDLFSRIQLQLQTFTSYKQELACQTVRSTVLVGTLKEDCTSESSCCSSASLSKYFKTSKLTVHALTD